MDIFTGADKKKRKKETEITRSDADVVVDVVVDVVGVGGGVFFFGQIASATMTRLKRTRMTFHYRRSVHRKED